MERVQDYYARRSLEQLRRDQPRLRREFWDRKRADAKASELPDPITIDEEVTPVECARYWGDGW